MSRRTEMSATFVFALVLIFELIFASFGWATKSYTETDGRYCCTIRALHYDIILRVPLYFSFFKDDHERSLLQY